MARNIRYFAVSYDRRFNFNEAFTWCHVPLNNFSVAKAPGFSVNVPLWEVHLEIGRREFLAISGSVAITSVLGTWIQGLQKESDFPEKFICHLQDLTIGKPLYFSYLHRDLGQHQILKLEKKVSGGVSSEENIIAFHSSSQPSAQVRLIVKGDRIYAHGFLTDIATPAA